MNRLIIIGLIGGALIGVGGSSVVSKSIQTEVQPRNLVSNGLGIDVLTFDERVKQLEQEYRKRLEEEARARAELERQQLEQLHKQQELERKQNVGFNAYNLLDISGITGDEMYELLKHRGVRDVAHAIVEAEQTYGVNAILLAGLVCLESGWGESARSTGWTNNMTGMGVPTDSSVGTVYESRQACVLDTARQLKKFYLTEGGNNYNGTSIWNVNTKYSASKTWAEKILDISNKLLASYKAQLEEEV